MGLWHGPQTSATGTNMMPEEPCLSSYFLPIGPSLDQGIPRWEKCQVIDHTRPPQEALFSTEVLLRHGFFTHSAAYRPSRATWDCETPRTRSQSIALSCYVTLGKSLPFSGPHFPHKQNKGVTPDEPTFCFLPFQIFCDAYS